MSLKLSTIFLLFIVTIGFTTFFSRKSVASTRQFNSPYTGENLNKVAFPIGGIGAGMVCLEGSGAISHVSVRNEMDFFNEPCTFAAVSIKNMENGAKVLEGPIPDWKYFGQAKTGNGSKGKTYGLPRFKDSSFFARFPFGEVKLKDDDIPLEVTITGWSPFIPGDADNSSLPVGALEYTFRNPTKSNINAVFSFNTENFMLTGRYGYSVLPIENGFLMWQDGSNEDPEDEGGFAVFTDDEDTVVDHCWFKGGWWDSFTLAWRNVKEGNLLNNPPIEERSGGASLFVPIKLKPDKEKTVRLMFAWYVPNTNLRSGKSKVSDEPLFVCGPAQGKAKKQHSVTGFLGKRLVNTFFPNGDKQIVSLTSPKFIIDSKYIHFLIGGGDNPGETCINLIKDDEIIKTSSGKDAEELVWETWDVEEFKESEVMIQIVDKSSSSWGHINIDHIVMTDMTINDLQMGKNRKDNSIICGPGITVIQDFESPDYMNWTAECSKTSCSNGEVCEKKESYHVPWYAGRFKDVNEVVDYWRNNYENLRKNTALFRDTFYNTTLPDEVIEAVASNLSILKSPTVCRQTDGRLWCFEGCGDDFGCCPGSCTHVWNYAQAIPHLFPDLERTLRDTEFNENQDEKGHQGFRACLPIQPMEHNFHAASDGQLGGIMKVYRDWRISGDTEWLIKIWPKVKQSLNYCIKTWDPRGRGCLEEPHHNTYDIEYWGPDSHCGSFYLGALAAAIKIGDYLEDDVSKYKELLEKGKKYYETELYNGEYFYHKIMTEGLDAKFKPLDDSYNGEGYKDIIDHLNKQGPKYQYGTGCLSDGVLGFWMAEMCGMDECLVDENKIKSHLKSIYKYNLKYDLSKHSNPQRPSFAMGDDGGLLLCTWPKGGALAIPFVYSDEVWTGVEYQVASHLMLEGMVDEGLDIVRICRKRYDGIRRNPFNEYECGHFYARALSSYGMLQGLTGVKYDAVDKTLYIDSKIGNDFKSFLSTETGFGTVGLKNGKPFIDVKYGNIDIKKVLVSGVERIL